MKTIKGFEGEDIVVSDFGEWVGKNYIDYKSDYKNNRKIIKILSDENSKLKDNWNKLKEYLETIYKGCPPYEKEVLMFIIDKMQELEQGVMSK